MIRVYFAGNALVIAAILLERNLQNVANYLIVSLAVADLMVACLVMPLGAVYEVRSNNNVFPRVPLQNYNCNRTEKRKCK